MSGLSVGSVCSGIGAPECAWQDMGWRFVWQAEIEDAPSAVLRHHFPGVPNLGDMTLLAGRVRSGEIEAPDVLVGGTPCQDFSVAGLRAGLAGDRGNLALAFVELANAIDAVRRADGRPAAFILWENVPGVFSDDDNAFGAILGGLVGSERAVPAGPDGGWDSAGVVDGPDRCAAWRVLDAQHFGVAQRRRRVFVLARGGADRWACADALLPLIQGMHWHPAPRRVAGEEIAPTPAARTNGSGGLGADFDLDGGLIASTLQAGGHANNPLDETLVVCNETGIGEWHEAEIAGTIRSGNANGNGGARQSTLIAFNAREDCDFSGDIAGPLSASSPQAKAIASAPFTFDWQKGNDVTNKRPSTMNIAEDISLTLSTTRVPAVSVALRGREGGGAIELGDDLAFTLRASSGGGDKPHVLTRIADSVRWCVRRLMPIECERLQGFPDGWTDVPAPGRNASLADSPRYKALGNSMAVPVLHYIGQQMAAVRS